MLSTIVMPQSCSVDRADSTDESSSNYDDAEYDDNSLISDDENYVCDISTMTISENENAEAIKDVKNACQDNNQNTMDDTLNKENCTLTPMYLNELEIDSHEEEQTITELVQASTESSGAVLEANQYSHMRVAFGIILRLVLPLANGVARSIKGIRDVRFLRALKSIASSRQALTNLFAFAANTISMNLSSVQVSHRIEPILKLMKIRKSRDGLESLPDLPVTPTTPGTPSTPSTCYSPLFRQPNGSALPNFPVNQRKPSVPEEPAPKCCTLNVLAEPPPGQPIRADIIFIHGLHGSLKNTWKQGLWENERRPVEFERPPKPPVRPPKRARHSRSTHIRPPHKQKRARFAHLDEQYRQSTDLETHDEDHHDASNMQRNDFTYVCGAPDNIKVCDGIEYSFPTFRIRMNDNGRQLQAEIDSMINDENSPENKQIAVPMSQANVEHNKGKRKMTPDDPDYSKCWPGDWLPLDCPGVRVIAVNYTTDQYLWRPLWKKKESRTNLIQRAREMAELLIEQRVGYGHPIVWVGHSKGGLFVKQIIVDAWESGRPAMAPFWRSARGCFFYSVPHRGSHLASIKAPLLTRSIELIDIEKNSKYLLDLHRRFAGLYHLGHLKIEVFSFVETALTLMSVLYLRIVGVDSADPGIGDVCGIRLDHREICKPRSRECILYKELVKMIKKVC